jgi:5-methylcytosine-specific restriction endonuclease McrA
MKVAALIATLSVAAPAFARDSWTGMADRRDLARSLSAARSADYCGAQPRSSRAKAQFRKQFVCPSTGKHGGACPGWVVDHVVALKRCGRDAPTNMAWQTKEQAKRKDRWE